MDTKKLMKMKNRRKEIDQTKNRLKGRLEANGEEIRRFGFNDVKHMKKELEKLRKKESDLDRVIEKQLKGLEKYDWD